MQEYRIRFATEEDTTTLFTMCLKFITESPYHEDEVDPEEILEMINSLREGDKKEKILLVAEDENKTPVGMIAGVITKHLFNKSKIANELIWWVDSEHRKSRIGLRLIEAFEFWGSKVKAKKLHTSTLDTNQMKPLERLYRSKKYILTEKNFMKDIN